MDNNRYPLRFGCADGGSVVAADGCFDFKPGSVQSNDKAVAESAAPDADKDTAKTGGTHTVLVTAGNGGTTDPNGSLTVKTGRA